MHETQRTEVRRPTVLTEGWEQLPDTDDTVLQIWLLPRAGVSDVQFHLNPVTEPPRLHRHRVASLCVGHCRPRLPLPPFSSSRRAATRLAVLTHIARDVLIRRHCCQLNIPFEVRDVFTYIGGCSANAPKNARNSETAVLRGTPLRTESRAHCESAARLGAHPNRSSRRMTAP